MIRCPACGSGNIRASRCKKAMPKYHHSIAFSLEKPDRNAKVVVEGYECFCPDCGHEWVMKSLGI